MRVIEQEMTQTFFNRGNKRKANDRVVTESGITRWYLHGNLIAELSNDGLYIQDAGWQTRTTKSRLNALLSKRVNVRIYQSNHRWYIGNESWNGSKVIDVCIH